MTRKVQKEKTPQIGQVVEWTAKNYGWIKPERPLEHQYLVKRKPDRWGDDRHDGDVFVHADDIIHCGPQCKWSSLSVGAKVEFVLYTDKQGLGASECVAHKYLRMPLKRQDVTTVVGDDGGLWAEFEKKMKSTGVVLNLYRWNFAGENDDKLAFCLVELRGRPEKIIEECLDLCNKTVGNTTEILIPESRYDKVTMLDIEAHCHQAILSPELTILMPIACRTLALTGNREECRFVLNLLIGEVLY